MSKSNCYECIHRGALPGSCHSRCRNISAKVKMNPYGVKSGWGLWPIDFDPIWVESCDGFSQDTADKIEGGEDDELMGLLAAMSTSLQ